MDQNSSSFAIRGLTREEVLSARKKYGENRITHAKRKNFLRQYAASFGDPVIKILLIVLGINIVFMFRNFDWFETAGIAISIFLATFISTFSEYGSESAFLRLQEDAEKITCRVKRAEGVVLIPISEIVVGDLVLLQSGERIPADGILISGKLGVDQSPLNGESKEAEKLPGYQIPNRWDLSDHSQVFHGCTVSSGDGVMRVVHVGDKTVYGDMARQMQEDTRESPLKVRLAGLTRIISRLGYIAAALVIVADLFNSIVISNGFQISAIQQMTGDLPTLFSHIIHAVMLGVTVVVVSVPEGLPMMITVVLSSNMKRMLKDHVLVRKLVGIETAGSLNLLFTDKTGTLTRGQLEVCSVISGEGACYSSLSELSSSPFLSRLVWLSARYNTGSILSAGQVTGGNATDRALLSFFSSHPGTDASYRLTNVVPFDSAYKFSSVHISGPDELELVKGAPELILSHCTHYYDASGNVHPFTNQKAVTQLWQERTSQMERVLALAVSPSQISPKRAFSDLIFIGFICIRDEIRPDTAGTIHQIERAGIQVVMVTGDNKETAVAIAKKIGLLSRPAKYSVLTSQELAEMTDIKLRSVIRELRVVARALPSDKSRLVRVAQEAGLVAGMTGDGINDAPALKKADVGFAMGTGTEVAKEAGDIVILNNTLSSISKAILYGRTVFKSIRKFIVFQLTMNLCAVGVSLIGPFIGIDTPVTVVQMLWINMIMDTLGGLAFSGEAPLANYMSEAPKRRDEPILNGYMANQIGVTGGLSVLLCTLFLKSQWIRGLFGYDHDPIYFLTAFFALFIFCGVFNSFNARTHRLNLFAHLRQNRAFLGIMVLVAIVQIVMIYFGGSVFRTAGLPFPKLVFTCLLAFLVVPIDLLRKGLLKLFHRSMDY